MKCTILHDTAGRIRVHLEQPRMSLLQADILEAYLRNTPGVADVTVHDRTGNATILYTGQRAPIVAALAAFSYEKSAALAPEHSVRVLNREYEGKLIFRRPPVYIEAHPARAIARDPYRDPLAPFPARRHPLSTAREDRSAGARRDSHCRIDPARRL